MALSGSLLTISIVFAVLTILKSNTPSWFLPLQRRVECRSFLNQLLISTPHELIWRNHEDTVDGDKRRPSSPQNEWGGTYFIIRHDCNLCLVFSEMRLVRIAEIIDVFV